MTYAELLKQNGATDEEIKVLDSPAARKAFDKLQSDAAAAAADAAAARAHEVAFKNETDEWYNGTIVPNYTTMEQRAQKAEANEARARALILASQDEGLKKVAKDLGYVPDGGGGNPSPNPNPGSPNFDPSKYVSREDLSGIMERAGEGLAALEDMVIEHSQLFPTQRLNVRELRREAVAAKKSAYEYWEQKYKVPDARAAQEAARQTAHDQAIRDEAIKTAREQFATEYGTPGLAPPAASTNPFAKRPDRGRTEQPWEAGDQSNTRVQYATKKVMEQISGTSGKAN